MRNCSYYIDNLFIFLHQVPNTLRVSSFEKKLSFSSFRKLFFLLIFKLVHWCAFEPNLYYHSILKQSAFDLKPKFYFAVSASFVPGTESNTGRQRHAPLYGRLVPEEHLPATHRDVVHQVSTIKCNTC